MTRLLKNDGEAGSLVKFLNCGPYSTELLSAELNKNRKCWKVLFIEVLAQFERYTSQVVSIVVNYTHLKEENALKAISVIIVS